MCPAPRNERRDAIGADILVRAIKLRRPRNSTKGARSGAPSAPIFVERICTTTAFQLQKTQRYLCERWLLFDLLGKCRGRASKTNSDEAGSCRLAKTRADATTHQDSA
jgi:hypothetical protein